jgi:hypothetical protein
MCCCHLSQKEMVLASTYRVRYILRLDYRDTLIAATGWRRRVNIARIRYPRNAIVTVA